MPTLALGNGQPDSFFIQEVRRIFRDQLRWTQESPVSDGSRGALGVAGSSPIHLQQPPIARTAPATGALTGPAGANQPGFSAYTLLFDPPPPTGMPTAIPSISDGGAGVLAAGVYAVAYTFVTAAGEQGLSFLSNSVTIAVNHQLTLAAITGLPAAVTAIRVYIVSSNTGSNVGFVVQIPVTSGATAATNLNAAGNGIIPAVVVTDTSELFFSVAPIAAGGPIAIQYQSARYSDQQVLDALYEGLGMLWPEIWSYQTADLTSVLPSPIQYEYVLPATYANLRAIITEVETRPPSAFIIFKRISGWRFMDDPVSPTLIFERPPPVGGQVRIRYVIPFQQLADVPGLGATSQLLPPANLPIYYAVARLLADAEVMRSRSDDLPSLTGENAGSEKGGNLQTSAWWLQNMFAPQLKKLSIGVPYRLRIMERAVERLGLGPIWRTAA